MTRSVVSLTVMVVCLGAAPARAERYFKGEARARALAEIERLRPIKTRHQGWVLGLPGVNAFGIGLDKASGTLVFDVMIDPAVCVPALPAILEGVPVRVKREPRVYPIDSCTTGACHNGLQSLPVEMGNTGHTGPQSLPGGTRCASCTMGFKACDVATGNTVLVTAAHCTTSGTSQCAGGAATGDPYYHRSPQDSLCALESVVGTVAKQRPALCNGYNVVEASSVNSDAGSTQISIRDIGAPSYLPGTIAPGDDVQKSGRTTGWTVGEVTNIGVSVPVLDPDAYCGCTTDVIFDDQIRIERSWNGSSGFPAPWAVYWTKGGDSGSAVLEMDVSPPGIVGLSFVASVDGTFGYANRIENVMAELDLSLNHLDCVSSNPCLATELARQLPPTSPALDTTVSFRDRVLSRSPRGRGYVDVYYRFTGAFVALVRQHPALRSQTAQVYVQIVPTLAALVAGGEVAVPAERIQAVDQLMARYQELSGDPALRAALEGLRADLHDPAVLRSFGVTVR